MPKLELAKRAVIAVGIGRGFVVEGSREKLCVITAAHCLPRLPPVKPTPYDPEEVTYHNLLGRLGEPQTVSAECLFADPLADIAVLGEPDAQRPSLNHQNKAYRGLMPDEPLSIGNMPKEYKPKLIKTSEGELIEAKSNHESLTTEAWVLSLDGNWFACEVK